MLLKAFGPSAARPFQCKIPDQLNHPSIILPHIALVFCKSLWADADVPIFFRDIEIQLGLIQIFELFCNFVAISLGEGILDGGDKHLGSFGGLVELVIFLLHLWNGDIEVLYYILTKSFLPISTQFQ